MGCRVAVLEARKQVMEANIEVVHGDELETEARSDDGYEGELYGVFIPPVYVAAGDEESANRELDVEVVEEGKRVGRGKEKGGLRSGGVTKGGGRSRFIPMWDERLDRRLKKCLKRFGWGCWKRIERSGKLPPGYSTRIIANRTKALKLNPEDYPNPSRRPSAPETATLANL